jgi:hypothetical protein
MFAIDTSPDRALHRESSRIASRLVFMIQPLLRSADDRSVALREAYAIARESLEAYSAVMAANGAAYPAAGPDEPRAGVPP